MFKELLVLLPIEALRRFKGHSPSALQKYNLKFIWRLSKYAQYASPQVPKLLVHILARGFLFLLYVNIHAAAQSWKTSQRGTKITVILGGYFLNLFKSPLRMLFFCINSWKMFNSVYLSILVYSVYLSIEQTGWPWNNPKKSSVHAALNYICFKSQHRSVLRLIQESL